MKNAMVWGAAGGIGLAVTRALVSRNWNVIGLSRSTDRLEDLSVTAIECEFGNEASIRQAIIQASQEVSEIDLWVYSAGDICVGKITDLGTKDFRRILDINLTGAYLAFRESQPLLGQDSHLFMLGAYSDRLRLPGFAAYAASKAGLEAFVEVLSKEERNLKITLVRPAAVSTGFWDKVPIKLPPNAVEPEEIATRILDAYEIGKRGNLDL